MTAPIAIAVLAVLSAVAALRRRRSRMRAPAVMVTPLKSSVVVEAGEVRSVQSADFTLTRSDLDRVWNATNLENLARTYWRFLSRVTLGLIRVIYGENERSVVLIAKPLTLLRFELPEYELDADRGKVTWRIRGGLLVARTGRGSGYLSIEVRREDTDSAQDGDSPQNSTQPRDGDSTPPSTPRLHIEIEVANFYPSIATGFSMPVYKATQSWIHVVVTYGFLRSLATLELAESKVGKLAATVASAAAEAELATPEEEQNRAETRSPSAQP